MGNATDQAGRPGDCWQTNWAIGKGITDGADQFAGPPGRLPGMPPDSAIGKC